MASVSKINDKWRALIRRKGHNYSPDNCKWATADEQYSNKTKTVYVNFYGKDYPLRDLVKASGIKYMTAYCRIKQYGWTPERTFQNIKPESVHDTDPDIERHPCNQKIVAFRQRKTG